MVSPVTPVVALALGACAPPLYVNDVVVPHVTAIDFGFIVHDLFVGAVWFPSGVQLAVYVPASVAFDVPPTVPPLQLHAVCPAPLYVLLLHVNVAAILFITHVIDFAVVVPSLHLWFPSGVHVCVYVPAFVALVVPPAVLPAGHVIPLACELPV